MGMSTSMGMSMGKNMGMGMGKVMGMGMDSCSVRNSPSLVLTRLPSPMSGTAGLLRALPPVVRPPCHTVVMIDPPPLF